MVVTYHHGTVRVAKNDLRTHIDEFIHKEETTLEHLLMEEDATASLGSHYQQDREKVWSQTWPRSIRESHDGAVDKGIDDIMLLFWNEEIIALYLDFHTQAAEGIRNDSQILDRYVLDADTSTTHGSHSDEGTHLDHIRQNGMFGSMQTLHAHDGEEIAGDTADACSHRIEQMAELLDIGFAGCIIDGGSTLGEHGSHDDIGGTRNGSLIEQHIAALQVVCLYLIDIALVIMHKLGSQIFETQEVSVETTATNLVATWLGNRSLSTTAQERTNHEHAATKRGAFLHKLYAVQIVEIEFIALESIIVAAILCHLDSNFLQQLDEIVDIEDVRHVLDAHRILG